MAETPAAAPAEAVVLIHGLFRSRRSLSRLHRHLDREGYRVIDHPYRSTRARISEHARRLGERITALDGDPSIGRIHIVSHSMGGIVVRQALAERVPRKLGRVVMLAPPNQGSRRARRFAPLFEWLVRPLGELSDEPGSEVRRIGVPAGIEIGIIAGSRDRTVPAETTHLPGESDFLVVKSGHTFIMNRREVLEQVAHFLRHGRFKRPPPAAPPE
ncbi:MAG: alpha/beta fold hydrolase [Planctomycetota bacterium]